jgi:hypothetical protein
MSKAYAVLDELFIGGHLQEPSVNVVTRQMERIKMEEIQADLEKSLGLTG